MAVPSTISAAVLALSDAYDASIPLADAAPLVFAGVRDKAETAVAALDAGIEAQDAAINGFVTPVGLPDAPAALLAHHQTLLDQTAMCGLRGLVGRVRSNIKLAQV